MLLNAYYGWFYKRPDVLNDEIKWSIQNKLLPGNEVYEFDPYLVFRWKPLSIAAYKKVNAAGFIQNQPIDTFKPEKPADVYRIFLLGGSSVAGKDLMGYGTISHHLERLLNTGSQRYEVINAGVFGYTSTQELIYTVNEILSYKPDMVISFDGYNDLRYPYEAQDLGISLGRNGTPAIEKLKKAFSRSQSLGGAIQQFIFNLRRRVEYSYATWLLRKIDYITERKWGFMLFRVDRLLKGFYGLPSIRTPVSYSISPEIIDNYTRNIRNLAGISQANGIKYIGALQPVGVYQKTHVPILIKAMGEPFVKSFQENYDLVRQKFALLKHEFSSKNKVQIVDLSQLFTNASETIYEDEVHYLEPGAIRIAQALRVLVLRMRNPS